MPTCLSAHALECGWEAPNIAHVPLCPCAGALMGGTHRYLRASLPMRWSVEGRHPPLLRCFSLHAMERRWEAPTVAHVLLGPCARACMGGTHRCSRALVPMRWSVDGRHPLLLTCLFSNALGHGRQAPAFVYVPPGLCTEAWKANTHACSRASMLVRWSIDRRHPPLLTCLCAHALQRVWEAPTLAHVPLCPCAGAWTGGIHVSSRACVPMRWSMDGRAYRRSHASLPMHWSMDRRHPSSVTCLFAQALER